VLLLILSAVFAPWIAPHDPFDPGSISIMDSFYPPAWERKATRASCSWHRRSGPRCLVDNSLRHAHLAAVGFSSVILAMVLGISLGLLAGYAGGRVDSIIMRIADVQLTFPPS
jgi:peptide/nickel transport system permease protein